MRTRPVRNVFVNTVKNMSRQSQHMSKKFSHVKYSTRTHHKNNKLKIRFGFVIKFSTKSVLLKIWKKIIQSKSKVWITEDILDTITKCKKRR